MVQTEHREIVPPVAEHHYRRGPAPTSPPEMPVPTDVVAPTSPAPPSPPSAPPLRTAASAEVIWVGGWKLLVSTH
eukprot:5719465-Amphidinium_carterae.1